MCPRLLPGLLYPKIGLHSRNFFTMRNPAFDNSPNRFSVFVFFILFSCIFWISLSVFFFFNLYDTAYGKNSNLHFFSSFLFWFKTAPIFLLTFLVSCLVGFFLSVPAILAKITVQKIQATNGKLQRSIFWSFFLKHVLPVLLLLFFNFSFLIINFAVEPGFLSKFFHENSIIQRLANGLHEAFFEEDPHLVYKNWRKIGQENSNESVYLFLMDRDVLEQNNQYVLSKALLKNSIPVVLTNSSKIDIVLNNKDNKNFIGVDAKNSFSFAALFPELADLNAIPLSWYSVFLNRFATAQPQFMVFYRTGMAGVLYPAWKWENINSNNELLLSEFSKKTIQSGQKFEKYIFLLTDFENEKNRNLLKSMEIQGLDKVSGKMRAHANDVYLSHVLKALLDSGARHVFILPYADSHKKIQISTAYAQSPEFNLEKKESVFYNKFFGLTQDDQEMPLGKCESENLQFNAKEKEFYFQNDLPLDLINSKKELDPTLWEVDFVLKNRTDLALVCESPSKKILLINEKYAFSKNQKQNGVIYRNLFSKLFVHSDVKGKRKKTATLKKN